MQQQGINVTLIEFAPHVLPRQIDLEASEFLTEHLIERDVTIACNSAIQKTLGDDSIIGVKCSTGEEYPSDLVIFSTGVVPNIGLVKNTMIKTDKGIIVDKQMRTNIPNIYAAGDVAQNEYRNSGIWVPAMEMGKIAGANIVGKKLTYEPLFTSTMLTAFDTKIFSIGEISDSPEFDVKTIIDPKKRFFKKIFARDGILVGAILIGDISEGTRLAKNLGAISFEDAKELIA